MVSGGTTSPPTEKEVSMSKKACEDCGCECDLIPWKYEPSVKLCESCYDERMDEEENE